MNSVWRIRILVAVLALIATGMGYLYFTQRISPQERSAAILKAQPKPTAKPANTAPNLVNFAQMLAVPYDLDNSSAASAEAVLSFIADNKPGAVTLFGSQISAASAAQAISDIADSVALEERPLIAVDHEGGKVQRLSGSGFTTLPTWKRLCDQTSDQRQALLASSAAQLRTAQINIVFAPMVDVAANNPVLKDRVCSGDPELVATAALDFVTTFQAQQMLPVIKHYPGLGSATTDTHSQLSLVTITENDTAPFKTVLDQFPKLGVMTAHIAVQNQSANLPCSLSGSCVGQLFELYPEVTVFTDALEMGAARYNYQVPEIAKSLGAVSIEAILAGNNVLVYGQDVTPVQLQEVLSRIKQEYTSSSEFREKVNLSVAKIQTLKIEYGVGGSTNPPTKQND
ncbi:MAG: hypothetical protein COY81_01875 [Candidatus Pacebacteria bacterium CG_4_10_14_0_8_um_filter_43_12]|nr:MAG: hypothetical protein COU66_01170 [Candidatus Pacebacteria bacterium CG10_big_fil_rev_8_21_14_0_10_44_11]PIY79601.1 MAG: hypothetical protein COY81_01875 [Candidatus Pacebacteria bacterium CG_4_10_14_0_8_um_filter_43_12]